MVLRASPGKGDDQTRQAVPLPNKSTVDTVDRLSMRGKVLRRRRSLQALPDWLK